MVRLRREGGLDDWLRSGDICGAVVAEASCFSSAALVGGVGLGLGLGLGSGLGLRLGLGLEEEWPPLQLHGGAPLVG